MTSADHTPGPGDGLDFWSFVRLAEHRLRELGFAHPEATELLLTLNRAAGVVTYDLEAAVHRPHGRSWAAFRLMYVLWLAGPLESGRAAELCGSSRAAVSNLTRPLHARGVVSRSADPRDGRSVRLALTVAGEREIVAAFREQNDRERAWAEVLTPTERGELVALLTKLVGGVDRLDVRGRP